MSFRTQIIRRNKERGVAMLIAMLAIVLLAIIGLGFMFMADIENNVNTSYKQSEKAYFASRAGLENVRLLLVPPDPKTNLGAGPLYNQAENLTMPLIAANTGVMYVENPNGAGDVINPTTAAGNTVAQNPTLDDELCQERFGGLLLGAPPAAGAPCEAAGAPGLPAVTTYFTPVNGLTMNANSASALPFKWVRLTNKQNLMPTGQFVDGTQPNPSLQVCWDGFTQRVIPVGNTCDGTPSVATQSMRPVWLLTSLAVTKAGARRVTQMEIANSPPTVPNAPIATQAPVKLQGSYVLNSYDFCTCTCNSSGSGSNATTSCGGAGCYSSAYAVETQGDVTVVGNSTPVSGQPNPYLTGVKPWPFDINQLIDQYKQQASSPSWSTGCTGTQDFNSTPPQYLNCGTQTNQQFGTYPTSLPNSEPSPGSYTSVTEYIPGSVKLTAAATGSGILIVDGDLEINGGLNWYGLVLVRGKVSFTGGAGSNVNLYGSILAGEDVLAVNNIDGDTFGGSINFHYDVCALKRSGQQVPPRVLATHEITY